MSMDIHPPTPRDTLFVGGSRRSVAAAAALVADDFGAGRVVGLSPRASAPRIYPRPPAAAATIVVVRRWRRASCSAARETATTDDDDYVRIRALYVQRDVYLATVVHPFARSPVRGAALRGEGSQNISGIQAGRAGIHILAHK